MVFRQSQARRRRGQSASHRRRLTAKLWESLEPRIVLTGPYVNTHLSDDDMQALISGMQGVSAYGSRVSNSGPYGDVVKNIRRPDGTPVHIGDDNPLGGVFDEGVVNPLDDFFNVHNPATRDSDALVLSMRGAGLRPSIEGGLVDGELDEIRFDIHLERDIHRDLLTLDFSSPFYDRGIGLRHGGSVALDINIDVHFVFGIYLDDSLNLEQRFFVRDMELDTTARVVADYTPLEINIGILQARVPTFSITGELGIHTGLDRTPDETVRLSDLNADNSLDIVASTLTTNLFEGTFDVTAQVGNWEIAPSQYFEMAGEMLGLDPVIGFSPGFDEVLLFNRITTAEMVSAAERFGSWLGSLGELDAYDLAVPFTSGASVSTVYNVGTGMSGEIASLRDDTGNPVFDSAQSFPLNDSMVFDPATDQLRYTVSRSLPTQLTSSRRTRVAADDLLSLSSGDAAEISADADVEYTLIFDLSEETADIGTRTRVDDLRVTTSFAPSASALAGDAAFQSLGLQYADASLSGEYQVIADFGNPNPLGGALSLDQLYDRLNGSQQVFKRPIRSSGSSSLTLTGLSVIDNLFSFGDPGASITAVVSDLVSGTMDVSYDRAPELQSFENLTVDSMLDSLSEAILGTSDWSDAANESLATVDQTIENFVSVRQQKIVEAIDEGRADFDRAVTGTRIVLQDVPGFLNNLSVAVKSGFVTFSSNFAYHTSQGVLNLLFSADVEENQSVPVGLGFESLFDYTQEDEVSETMDFTGPRGEVDSFSSQSLDVGLDMDVSDPSHPTAYVNSATRLESRVYVNASSASGNAVSMDGASGSLGLALGDGKLVIAQDINSPNANAPARFITRVPIGAQRVRLNDWSNFQPNKNAFGGLSADFEVTPDTTGSAEPVRLSFNISDLADALANTQLITSPSFPSLRSGIDLSLQLQSLGPSISELFSALEAQIKEQVLGIDLPLVGKSIDSAANFIRKMRIEIENVLGPLTAFDRATVEAALEQAIANLFGIPGDYRDAVQVDLSVPTALRFVFDFQGVPILQNVQAKTNFGLPALGAEVDANLLVSGLYRVKLDVVVSLTDGVYIDTSNESISVDLNVAMNGSAVGKLGFVEVVVATAVGPTTCSAFDATFAIGLTDPNNDGKFKLNEIGRGSLIDASATGISGCSEMRFDITASANEMLPSFRTGLNIDWEFNGLDLRGDIPEVTFSDVQLELGGFIAHVIAPFLTRLEPILDPIEPILDLLTSDLPVLDTAGVNASILDLGFAFAEHLPRDSNIRRTLLSILEFIEAVDSINRLANAVAIDGATGARLNVGNLTFGGSITPQYDARTAALAQTVIAAAQTRNDVMDQFFADSAAPHMGDVITTSRAQIHFPILENPTQVFEWLLGFGQAEIVTLKLPGVHANIPIDVPIPIFPGILEASIYGSITADMELMVGIDTYGASEFQKTGNGLDFLKGFYVSDRENADGTGRDVPELPIVGKALAGLGVGFDVGGVGISAKVGGGIEATIDFDLIDPDNDGKVRGFELSSPKGCLAINGSVSATLEASATVGFLNFDFPIASAELGRFNTVVHCSRTEDPANLGRINQQTGELVVFMGPTANRRSVMPDVVDEEIEVVQDDTSITIYAFGASESFDLADVTSIYVDGGTGADRILIDASVTKPTVLLGGEEDDFIQGGRGTDTIAGNSGNDEIHGGNGADTIYGNDGHDKLFGDDGIDTISGGDGNDEIHGGNGADVISTGNGVNTAYGDNGNDTLLGGDERDNLYGGDDDDTLFGYGGRNVLLGDEGVDTIHGGLNDDVIHGGADGDFIYGSLGRDTIYGDTGDDEIHGDEGNDYLEGNDGNDTIFGELGLDTIYGGAQNDTIDGGVGNDELHGDADDDTIYGRDGIDSIFGGEGGDILHGNGGNDVIHGEAGFDILMGGPGNDELFGDQGNDTIYGNDDDPNEDRSDPDFTDDDFIYGGPDSDSVTGGWGVDHIYGEAGGDVLQGNQEADFIDGGAGPDVIYGQDAPQSTRSGTDGADEIYAGDDNDTVYGGPAADLIRGGNGNDTIFGEQEPDLIFGDAENDTIDGGGADDEIDGGTGNDHIIGSAGRDLLYGNDGFDVIEGNGGDDRIRGNVGADLLYGDDGEDEIRGGTGNDTIRGGNDDDTLRGDDGDDLILGFLGNDTIDGDKGNDVLYGNQGDDTIRGGFGLDRIYGEVGRDTLFGNEGNDVIEAGPGDDSVHGDDGEDALYGDEGVDEIWGGLGNDFIKAGNGIGDVLHGDEGNDTIIGSDDGENDPNLKDTIFFGDRIDGGDGDDVINSLGGSDIVDGGLGNDIIHGGAQADSIVGGPASITALQTDEDALYGDDGDDQMSGGAGDDAISGGDGTDAIDGGSGTNAIDDDADSPLPAFAPSLGPERRGPWSELSNSATGDGISQIGGFEESVLAGDFGVYVAWVDSRNGNYEIYVAYHPKSVGAWTQLIGPTGTGSASGGGVSNDAAQSRRPSLFKTANSDTIGVVWTSIQPDGSSTIETALEETGWARISSPAQTGHADNAVTAAYSDDSMQLAWIDESSGTREARITQFVYQPGCYVGYAGNSSTLGAGQPGVNVSQIDLAAADVRAGLILSYGDTLDHDLKLFTNRGFSIIDQSTLCPAVPNASVQVNVAGQWTNIHTETDGDLTQPTIGVQLIDVRSQGQNETEVAVDIVFAWQRETDRVDQIDGAVIRIPFSGPVGPARPLIPQYASDATPRAAADNVSVNYGYAAHPELAVSYYGTFLAWMDDDVTFTGGDSNIFILSRYRDPDSVDYVMSEFEPHDASGQGISETGRSLQHISLGLDNEGFTSTDPYVVWTEAALTGGSTGDAPTDGIYLRVNQFGLTLVDDRSQGNKFQRQSIDVLTNDLNLFGELPGRIVKFDGRDVPETGTLQFVSPLGASVTVSAQGEVTYDPRGIPGFRRLRTGHSLTESFNYEVYNFIYRAEAIVTFQTNGVTSWSNLRNLLDVNDDGNITPLDALLIINQLNSVGPRSLFGRDPDDLPRFIDANNDGYVTALDALLVINRLNQGGDSEGEQGESTGHTVSAADDSAEAPGVGGSDISYQPYNRRRRLK